MYIVFQYFETKLCVKNSFNMQHVQNNADVSHILQNAIA